MSALSRTAARWAAPCLAVTLLAGCSGATQDGASDGATSSADTHAKEREIPLDVAQRSGQTIAFVPVTIQGHGPFAFVLDTGASSSAVDDDIARRLELPTTGERQPISGVVGTDKVPVVRMTSWKAGDVALSVADATVIDMQTPQGSNPRIQGLLGSDVLSRFGSVTVDFTHEVLRLPAH